MEDNRLPELDELPEDFWDFPEDENETFFTEKAKELVGKISLENYGKILALIEEDIDIDSEEDLTEDIIADKLFYAFTISDSEDAKTFYEEILKLLS